jgi:hypothetical protein
MQSFLKPISATKTSTQPCQLSNFFDEGSVGDWPCFSFTLFTSRFTLPSNMPHGSNPLTQSNITLAMAKYGIDKNIPEIPKDISPIITPKITTNGFNLTCDPTILGIKKLLSKR